MAVLIPCIDLQGGQAVQLVHGKKRALAVRDVMGLLEKFKSYPWLHVIDLDAAMEMGCNDALVRALCSRACAQYGIKVRVGGGIRTASRAVELIRSGANQVIVGTAAFKGDKVNHRFFRRLLEHLQPNQVVIAMDVAKGRIVVRGWTESLDLCPDQVMNRLKPFCAAFLCTDVDREGTLRGARLAWYQKLRRAVGHPIIAAGGIKTRRDVVALEKMGMDAAVGMAVYTGRLR